MGNANQIETKAPAVETSGVGGNITELNSKPPTIVSFKGSLYAAFKDATGLIYIGVSNDGLVWKYVKHIGQLTSDSPSLTVHNNYLYLAYRNGGSGIFVVRSEDGVNFTDTRSVGQ